VLECPLGRRIIEIEWLAETTSPVPLLGGRRSHDFETDGGRPMKWVPHV
jgi:hypothetical protein